MNQSTFTTAQTKGFIVQAAIDCELALSAAAFADAELPNAAAYSAGLRTKAARCGSHAVQLAMTLAARS